MTIGLRKVKKSVLKDVEDWEIDNSKGSVIRNISFNTVVLYKDTAGLILTNSNLKIDSKIYMNSLDSQYIFAQNGWMINFKYKIT